MTDSPLPFDLPARLHGLKVFVEPALEAKQWRQVRFPKSKKRRIRKKWAKRRDNWALVDVDMPSIVQTADALYVSPTVYAKLKRDPRIAEFERPLPIIPLLPAPELTMSPPTTAAMKAMMDRIIRDLGIPPHLLR